MWKVQAIVVFITTIGTISIVGFDSPNYSGLGILGFIIVLIFLNFSAIVFAGVIVAPFLGGSDRKTDLDQDRSRSSDPDTIREIEGLNELEFTTDQGIGFKVSRSSFLAEKLDERNEEKKDPSFGCDEKFIHVQLQTLYLDQLTRVPFLVSFQRKLQLKNNDDRKSTKIDYQVPWNDGQMIQMFSVVDPSLIARAGEFKTMRNMPEDDLEFLKSTHQT